MPEFNEVTGFAAFSRQLGNIMDQYGIRHYHGQLRPTATGIGNAPVEAMTKWRALSTQQRHDLRTQAYALRSLVDALDAESPNMVDPVDRRVPVFSQVNSMARVAPFPPIVPDPSPLLTAAQAAELTRLENVQRIEANAARVISEVANRRGVVRQPPREIEVTLPDDPTRVQITSIEDLRALQAIQRNNPANHNYWNDRRDAALAAAQMQASEPVPKKRQPRAKTALEVVKKPKGNPLEQTTKPERDICL